MEYSYILELDLGASILRDDDLVAGLHDHLDLVSVHDAAGADCHDFGNNGLFLR